MIDLAVAYRVYPGISKTPAFYSTDKFKLAELCLRSLKRGLGGLRAKVYALLDGCPPAYEALFRDVFQSSDLEIVVLNKIGNLATFSYQIDILRGQTEAQHVYFAEDDYFYFPDALEKMVAFMQKNQDVDFVTPYDHPDSYYTSARFERHNIRPFGDRYWRSASSTCLTFMTSKDILKDTESALRTYSSGNDDCALWLAMTQKAGLANLRVHWSDVARRKIWVKAWMWGFKRILLGRSYQLWTPMPTLATHMESTCLSPLIDWQEVFGEHL